MTFFVLIIIAIILCGVVAIFEKIILYWKYTRHIISNVELNRERITVDLKGIWNGN
jgi:hypothetical protein